MKRSALEEISKIEGLLQAGKLSAARRCLNSKQFRSIPYADRSKLADLARRLGEPLKAIRLLNPLVRKSSRARVTATPLDQAIYGACLARIGASAEALGVLQKIDPKQVPRSLLYQAHALFAVWDYGSAIALLREYVERESDPYQKIVGQVNLVAALVHEHPHSQSEDLLERTIEQTRQMKLPHLQGNCLEILAQREIFRRDWKSAERCLEQARALMQGVGGMDELFVQKWVVILQLFKSPKSASVYRGLEQLRARARRLMHWETLRDCDRFQSLVLKDEALFLKVYFGTPFPIYRQKLLADFPKKINLPEVYLWSIAGPKPDQIVRVLMDDTRSRTKSLKVGQLRHRLFRVLVSDFYKPWRLASVFSELYPNEYFDPVHSPGRIHQAVKELRLWMGKAKLPLLVKESQGSYQIQPRGSAHCGIEVPHPDWWNQNPISHISQIRTLFLDLNFSAAQVSQRLSLPRRTVFYILQRAMQAGVLVRIGRGPDTRYRFKK